MLTHPNFDPIALQLGPVAIHWYGLMYLAGFLTGWALGRYRAQRAGAGWTAAEVDDVVFYIALGVIVGGRLGYLLFYGWEALLQHPLSGLYIWNGGMSFHGGFLGVLVAMVYCARQQRRGFWETTDFIAPLIPPGLFFGRIGNFINGELWGRTTDAPWGIVFPHTGDGLPRHPSQLYEMGLEGICLFVLLWWFSARQRPTMAVSGAFLLGYGLFRTSVECFRQPDVQIGYLAFDWLTMGQLLSIPMICAGMVVLWRAYRR